MYIDINFILFQNKHKCVTLCVIDDNTIQDYFYKYIRTLEISLMTYLDSQ